MKPEELHSILQETGTSRARAAAMLGVAHRSIYRWLSGQHPIEPMVASIFGLLKRRRITPESFIDARSPTVAPPRVGRPRRDAS